MCQISSLMPAAEGPVAEFSSFANFEERKRKSNLLISFPKIVHQKGSFGQLRKNSSFRFCRPTLDIFGFTLLIIAWYHYYLLLTKVFGSCSHPSKLYPQCLFLYQLKFTCLPDAAK